MSLNDRLKNPHMEKITSTTAVYFDRPFDKKIPVLKVC